MDVTARAAVTGKPARWPTEESALEVIERVRAAGVVLCVDRSSNGVGYWPDSAAYMTDAIAQAVYDHRIEIIGLLTAEWDFAHRLPIQSGALH